MKERTGLNRKDKNEKSEENSVEMLSIDIEKKTRVELPATIHIYQLE